jgi:hypothetical protein
VSQGKDEIDNADADTRRRGRGRQVVQQTKTGRETDGVFAPPPATKYTLSAVAVFRDEELYLQEWCADSLSRALSLSHTHTNAHAHAHAHAHAQMHTRPQPPTHPPTHLPTHPLT